MKDIKILVSSLLIFLSFFIGYYFSETNKNIEIEKLQNKKNYVNLEILKTKIKISKDKNTKLTINWEIYEEEIIDLK